MGEGEHNRNERKTDEEIDERKYSWRKGQVCVCVAEFTVNIGDRMASDNLCRTELALILRLSTSACFFVSLLTVPHHVHISVSIYTAGKWCTFFNHTHTNVSN